MAAVSVSPAYYTVGGQRVLASQATTAQKEQAIREVAAKTAATRAAPIVIPLSKAEQEAKKAKETVYVRPGAGQEIIVTQDFLSGAQTQEHYVQAVDPVTGKDLGRTLVYRSTETVSVTGGKAPEKPLVAMPVSTRPAPPTALQPSPRSTYEASYVDPRIEQERRARLAIANARTGAFTVEPTPVKNIVTPAALRTAEGAYAEIPEGAVPPGTRVKIMTGEEYRKEDTTGWVPISYVPEMSEKTQVRKQVGTQVVEITPEEKRVYNVDPKTGEKTLVSSEKPDVGTYDVSYSETQARLMSKQKDVYGNVSVSRTGDKVTITLPVHEYGYEGGEAKIMVLREATGLEEAQQRIGPKIEGIKTTPIIGDIVRASEETERGIVEYAGAKGGRYVKEIAEVGAGMTVGLPAGLTNLAATGATIGEMAIVRPSQVGKMPVELGLAGTKAARSFGVAMAEHPVETSMDVIATGAAMIVTGYAISKITGAVVKGYGMLKETEAVQKARTIWNEQIGDITYGRTTATLEAGRSKAVFAGTVRAREGISSVEGSAVVRTKTMWGLGTRTDVLQDIKGMGLTTDIKFTDLLYGREGLYVTPELVMPPTAGIAAPGGIPGITEGALYHFHAGVGLIGDTKTLMGSWGVSQELLSLDTPGMSYAAYATASKQASMAAGKLSSLQFTKITGLHEVYNFITTTPADVLGSASAAGVAVKGGGMGSALVQDIAFKMATVPPPVDIGLTKLATFTAQASTAATAEDLGLTAAALGAGSAAATRTVQKTTTKYYGATTKGLTVDVDTSIKNMMAPTATTVQFQEQITGRKGGVLVEVLQPETGVGKRRGAFEEPGTLLKPYKGTVGGRGLLYGTGFKFGPSGRTDTLTATSTALKTSTATLTQELTGTKTQTTTRTTLKTLLVPTITPTWTTIEWSVPIGLFTPPDLGAGAGGPIFKTSSALFKQPKKYKHDITAAIFGIKGKAKKGLITGLEVRPVDIKLKEWL